MTEKLTAGTYRAVFKLDRNQNALANVHTVTVDVYLSGWTGPMSRKDVISQILYLMEWPKKYADHLVSLERIDQ